MSEFCIKEFLSDTPFESGCVVASIEVETNDRYNTMSADLVIKDCYKTITLDFCAHTEEKQKDRLKKIDKFIDVLVKFREELPKYYVELNEGILKEKQRKEKEKENSKNTLDI